MEIKYKPSLDLIFRLIKLYQELTPARAEKKKWSDYPDHISSLLFDIRTYCESEGINFDECLNNKKYNIRK